MSEIPLTRHSFVTSITLTALRKLGMESLDWDPLITRDAFELSLNEKQLPQLMFDKLNCGYTLISTDAFTATIEAFLGCTYVMGGRMLDGAEAPFCTLGMCAWSVWEYINLMGEMNGVEPSETFHPDIVKYIQEVARLDGVYKLPAWLKFAEPPIPALPDLSGDVHLFEMFMARQEEQVSAINTATATRQEALKAELEKLQELGILG